MFFEALSESADYDEWRKYVSLITFLLHFVLSIHKYISRYFFRQIATFTKIRMALVFGLQTL